MKREGSREQKLGLNEELCLPKERALHNFCLEEFQNHCGPVMAVSLSFFLSTQKFKIRCSSPFMNIGYRVCGCV